MTAERIVDTEAHVAFQKVESPTCAKCGKPMTFMMRQVVISNCSGDLYKAESEGGELLFSIDDEAEVAWDSRETWWACSSFDCYRALQAAGEDFPYEREFEGAVDWA